MTRPARVADPERRGGTKSGHGGPYAWTACAGVSTSGSADHEQRFEDRTDAARRGTTAPGVLPAALSTLNDHAVRESLNKRQTRFKRPIIGSRPHRTWRNSIGFIAAGVGSSGLLTSPSSNSGSGDKHAVNVLVVVLFHRPARSIVATAPQGTRQFFYRQSSPVAMFSAPCRNG